MAEKVVFGFSGCAIAFFDESSSDEAPVWETPIKIPGGVGASISPESSSSKFHADNIAYYSDSDTVSMNIEMEMALIPDEISARMLGHKVDSNGAFVTVVGGKKERFAILFQVETDVSGRRNVFYNCGASEPSMEHKTNSEGKEIATTKTTIEALPVKFGEDISLKSHLTDTPESHAKYITWYDAVYAPDFTGTPTP